MKQAVFAPLLAWTLMMALQPARAADFLQPKPVSPTTAELGIWKKNVLSKFDHVIYLEADRQPISETQFFERIEGGKREFDMITNTATPKQIELRLRDAGAAPAASPAR